MFKRAVIIVSTVLLAIMLVHGGNGIVSGLLAVVFIRDLYHNLLYVQFIKGHVLLSHAVFSF